MSRGSPRHAHPMSVARPALVAIGLSAALIAAALIWLF
jgi:hypothetical protein